MSSKPWVLCLIEFAPPEIFWPRSWKRGLAVMLLGMRGLGCCKCCTPCSRRCRFSRRHSARCSTRFQHRSKYSAGARDGVSTVSHGPQTEPWLCERASRYTRAGAGSCFRDHSQRTYFLRDQRPEREGSCPRYTPTAEADDRACGLVSRPCTHKSAWLIRPTCLFLNSGAKADIQIPPLRAAGLLTWQAGLAQSPRIDLRHDVAEPGHPRTPPGIIALIR